MRPAKGEQLLRSSLGIRAVIPGETRGGELTEGAAPDGLLQAIGLALHRRRALRVGQYGAKATHLEIVEDGPKIGRPSPEGHLQKQPGPVAAERQCAERLVIETRRLDDPHNGPNPVEVLR